MEWNRLAFSLSVITYLCTAHSTAVFAKQNCPNLTSAKELAKLQADLAGELSRNGSHKIETVLEKLDACFPQKNKIPACFTRIYDRAEFLLTSSFSAKYSMVTVDNELNMRRPPEELMAVEPKSNEKLMRLFQTNPYKDAEQIAKENGWPVVRYKSRHSGGFDSTTPSLLMIHVPGNMMSPPVDYDRYINIALPADQEDRSPDMNSINVHPIPKEKVPGPEYYKKGNDQPNTTTILTVQKGTGKNPSRIFFTKYDRSGEFWSKANINPVQACYSCHPNGMRSISPLGFSISAKEHAAGQIMPDGHWKKVREMNGSMSLVQKNGIPDWGQIRDSAGKVRPLLNLNGVGPVYGPLKPLQRKVVKKEDGSQQVIYPSRTKKFILSCAKENTTISVRDIFGRAPGRDNVYQMNSDPIDWKKVKKAMNCASCHDNKIHGSLNNSTDTSLIQYKILVDRSMPLWAHRNPLDKVDTSTSAAVTDALNLNERMALVNCLFKEFNEELKLEKNWLTELSCTQSNKVAPPEENSVNQTGNRVD